MAAKTLSKSLTCLSNDLENDVVQINKECFPLEAGQDYVHHTMERSWSFFKIIDVFVE